MQQQKDSVSKWCHDTGSLINPDKTQTLWCTLDNRASGKAMPAVTLHGAVVERTSHLRYLGIQFDRMLTCRKHVETTALKRKKGLSVPKAMAAKGRKERHLFLLYQSVVFSVTDYGLGLTTMALLTNLLKLDRVRNEAMRVTLGTTKDTPIETRRSMQTSQKVEQVKAYFTAVENPYSPLHEAMKDTKGCRLARGKSWMGETEDSIVQVCQLTEFKETKEWERYLNRFRSLYEIFLPEKL